MAEEESKLAAEEEQKDQGALPGRLISSFREMSRPRQLAFLILAAGAVIFIVWLSAYFMRPKYVPLFTGLEAQHASLVIERLKEKGVPYRLEDGGLTIAVPENQVYELRIELAGESSFYAQDLGFELFDADKLGMSESERQVRLQRALQEELRRTIVSLEPVEQARVHLVMPEPSVFLRETVEPTASVYLKLSPLASLSPKQVQGIVRLVAGSVEGLKPENVVLVDSQGNILHDSLTAMDSSMEAAESAMQQYEVKRAFEKELERRVQHMLERVFGPGKALALVSAELDFDSRERTVLIYDENAIPRSTQVIEETFEGEGPLMGEVGEANFPGYVAPYAGGDSSYERREEIYNYEIGETMEREITAPGKVIRLFTSVVVDDADNNLTPQQIGQVENLVASAIGYDPARGDLITVEGMAFDTSHLDRAEAELAALEEEEAAKRQLMMRIALGALLFILLLALVMLMRRRRRLRREAEEEELEEEVLPPDLTLEELLAQRAEEEAAAIQEDNIHIKVKKLVEENPESAAHVLRSWLIEE